MIVLAETNAKLKVKLIITNSKGGDCFIISSFIKNLVIVLKCKILSKNNGHVVLKNWRDFDDQKRHI
jgi:hypothetical protein